MKSQPEGVVKYQSNHTQGAAVDRATVEDLIVWRQMFYQLGLIGQNPNLYGGAGYGNVSRKIRVNDQGQPVFWITGTQTGGLEMIAPESFSRVDSYDVDQNQLSCSGPIAASSEAMTHGAVYEAEPDAKYVFHTHSKTIWSAYQKLNLQFTPQDVEYGTAEMARSVKQLSKDPKWTQDRAFVMLGHEDGVFTFGATAELAGLAMVKILTQAMKTI